MSMEKMQRQKEQMLMNDDDKILFKKCLKCINRLMKKNNFKIIN